MSSYGINYIYYFKHIDQIIIKNIIIVTIYMAKAAQIDRLRMSFNLKFYFYNCYTLSYKLLSIS
jgi:hypothetical protein